MSLGFPRGSGVRKRPRARAAPLRGGDVDPATSTSSRRRPEPGGRCRTAALPALWTTMPSVGTRLAAVPTPLPAPGVPRRLPRPRQRHRRRHRRQRHRRRGQSRLRLSGLFSPRARTYLLSSVAGTGLAALLRRAYLPQAMGRGARRGRVCAVPSGTPRSSDEFVGAGAGMPPRPCMRAPALATASPAGGSTLRRRPQATMRPLADTLTLR